MAIVWILAEFSSLVFRLHCSNVFFVIVGDKPADSSRTLSAACEPLKSLLLHAEPLPRGRSITHKPYQSSCDSRDCSQGRSAGFVVAVWRTSQLVLSLEEALDLPEMKCLCVCWSALIQLYVLKQEDVRNEGSVIADAHKKAREPAEPIRSVISCSWCKCSM